MTDRDGGPVGTMRVASTPVFVATFAAILAAIGLVLSFDLFLARIDSQESRAHAESAYADGVALLRRGRASDAAERFSTAVAIDRANVNYALALGEAMLEEGRIAEAEATLRALLERAENDGAVNLTMARVMLRQNRGEEAKAYLHRAVFGRWGADSVERRRQARFELIDLLARRGAASELLAELLPFEETSPDSVALRRRLGELFIVAGSPVRAANMFRAVLERDPNDADAYAGMGEAALAQGNFRTARADFAAAARLRPDDSRITGRLAVADTVLALDPTARGTGLRERYTRSQALLSRTLAAVLVCPGVRNTTADSARVMVSQPVSASLPEKASEAMMELALEMWSGRPSSCTPRDEALRLVMARLAQ